VHLRRALLLFAIVLGMAALAASLSRPREEREGREPPATAGAPERPTLAPTPASPPPRTVSLDAAREQVRKLELGAPATLEVSVEEPGLVEIPLLGLSASADPLTPARFEILPTDAGRYPLRFTAASGDEPLEAGVLDVAPSER
jgi:hypothetical protein